MRSRTFIFTILLANALACCTPTNTQDRQYNISQRTHASVKADDRQLIWDPQIRYNFYEIIQDDTIQIPANRTQTNGYDILDIIIESEAGMITNRWTNSSFLKLCNNDADSLFHYGKFLTAPYVKRHYANAIEFAFKYGIYNQETDTIFIAIDSTNTVLNISDSKDFFLE